MLKYLIKIIGGCVAATLLLVSCNKDTRIADNADLGVNFRVTSGAITKATPTTVANLSAFKVTAIGNSASYFTDLNVAVTSAGVCTPEKTYYWPGYELGFYAYANPSGGTASITNAAKGVAGVTPVAAAADQQDFVVAYSTGTKADNMASGVALNFRHALSQIKVKATNKSTAGLKINVKGVKVANVKASGDFSYPTAVTSGNNAATLDFALWNSSSASKTAYSIGGTSETAVALSATAADIMFSGGSWMLVPQQLTAWNLASDKTNSNANAYIGVYLQILDASNGQLYPATAGEYAYANVPIDTKWEPGKTYTYTLNFLDEAAGGGAGVDDAGNPVLGSPINFTLTIDDWDGAVESNITADMVNTVVEKPAAAPATTGTESGHQWVDLGIRVNGNKILYATTNIGAETPEDYGTYFQLGDTQKRYSSITGTTINGFTFDWSNYLYANGTNKSITKYCLPSYADEEQEGDYWYGDGSGDNKNVLEPEDDAAHVIWGGNWKVPSCSEFDPLRFNTNVNRTYTENYNSTGIAGVIITGKGDYSENSIFLPHTGQAIGTTIHFYSDGFYYWLADYCGYGDQGSALQIEIEQEWNDDLGQDVYYAPISSGVDFSKITGLPIRPVLIIPE